MTDDLPVREAGPHDAGEEHGDGEHRENAQAGLRATVETSGGPDAEGPSRHQRPAAMTSRVLPSLLTTAAITRCQSGVESVAGAPTGACRSIATGCPTT